MRLALALGVLLLCSCRIDSAGLLPDEVTDDDSGLTAADGAADGTTAEETLPPGDAIVSDTVFPVDDSGAVPECTGKADGTACGAATPRRICVGGECIPSRCGDGIVDLGEDCDDSNNNDGDNCPGDCKARCKGDGECDDKNECTGDACDLGRHVCAPPVSLSRSCTLATGGAGVCAGKLCSPPNCGNNKVESPEQCDDANTDDRDGCRSDCTWTCTSNADCDDKDACNGVETCDTSKHTCKAGTVKTCADGNGCTVDRCISPGGTCSNITIDLDGDGFSPKNLCSGATDCHDGNPRVRPDQTAWFTMPYSTPSGGSSFDYDCAGGDQKRYNTAGGCAKSGSSCTHTWGWVGGTPPCGGSDFVVEGCEGGSCKEIISSGKVAQECH